MARFADINVSHIATYARCSGFFNIHLTTDLPRNLWKFFMWFRFDRIVAVSLWPHFFGPSCYILFTSIQVWLMLSAICIATNLWYQSRKRLRSCSPLSTCSFQSSRTRESFYYTSTSFLCQKSLTYSIPSGPDLCVWKPEWWGAGVVVCLEQGADNSMIYT